MILRIFAPLAFALALTGVASAQPLAAPAPVSADFNKFLAELWKDAQAEGITRKTFDLAFAGVTPDPRVIATTKRQPEYNKPAGAYVNSIASAQNAKEGLRKEAQWRPTFEAVEKRFKVERWVILA